MLLIIGKRIRTGICHPINRYVKPNNKCMKDYNKNNESSYLKYLKCWNVNILHGWAMIY